MSPPSRVGEAYLSPMGYLYVVVSEPWVNPWIDEETWQHDMVVFGTEEAAHNVTRRESTVTELAGRTGWRRLA